jgi:hypothetical protein
MLQGQAAQLTCFLATAQQQEGIAAFKLPDGREVAVR